MRIFYGDVLISDGSQLATASGSDGYRLECAQVADVLQLWNAADADPLGRQNRTRSLPLSVAYPLESLREAETFWLDQFEALATAEQVLTFLCGFGTDTSTRYASAILEKCTPRLVGGNVVVIDYIFQCGPIVKVHP